MKLTIKKTIEVLEFEASGDEWQIFSYRPTDREPLYRNQAHYQKTVDQLNTAVLKAANSAKTRDDFIEKVEKTMTKLRRFGASDTEPRGFLQGLADRIYGTRE